MHGKHNATYHWYFVDNHKLNIGPYIYDLIQFVYNDMFVNGQP